MTGIALDPWQLPPSATTLADVLAYSRSAAKRIKFYMCGEYGGMNGRPHFHALLFGLDFTDRLYLKKTESGSKLYRSPTLENLWTNGFSSVGDITFESASYVARYVMKKMNGYLENKYTTIDPETGEIFTRNKEFNQMSRSSGIGHEWLKQYAPDIYTTGKVIHKGRKFNPPRYYDKLYNKVDHNHLDELKAERQLEASRQTEHHTPERLKVQEEVQHARMRTLKRNLT